MLTTSYGRALCTRATLIYRDYYCLVSHNMCTDVHRKLHEHYLNKLSINHYYTFLQTHTHPTLQCIDFSTAIHRHE